MIPPSIYQLDLHRLGLVLVDRPQSREIIRQPTRDHPDAPLLRTSGATTKEAWEKMWALLVREWGGIPGWCRD